MPDSSKPDSSTASGRSPNATQPEHESAADALRDGLRSASEAASYVRLFIASTLDRWKLSALTICLYIVLGIFGACAGIALVVSAVVLLLTGAAHGIGAALGGREWLGDLIVGFVLIAALTLSVTSVLDRVLNASRRRTMQKYAAKHSQQRQRFGQDATDSVHVN